MFYVAFVALLIFFTAIFNVAIISGIDEDKLSNLMVVNAPENPTIIDSVIFGLSSVVSWIYNFVLILTVSSAYQIVSLVFLILTAGLVFVLIKLLRGV